MLSVVRKAFTLMETLVALLLVVTMAAIILPVVVTKISTVNSSVLSGNLRAINQAILRYREDVGRYPRLLSQLTTRPTVGVSVDACGTAMNSTTVASWNGPYLSLSVGTSGIQSGDAIIANNLQRNPLTTSNSTIMNGVLQLSAGSVTGANASDAESVFDTGNDLDHGTITWIPTSGIIGTLTFSIPVRGC
ncbi:MAG: hypothetical protein M3Z17_07960 [Gemmatimonadota bacterium]|nr:hypothetical protein [Gemmatimonadota bacterium]